MKTLEITNFGGRLTRILNGNLNSGFAKFAPSFGYDPFTKPMNLTWLEQPTSITAGVTDMVVAMKTRFARVPQINYVFGVGSTGKIYKIESASTTNPQVDSVVGVSSIAAATAFGGNLEFFGFNERLYVGGDDRIVTTGEVSGTDFILNGASDAVGTTVNYAINNLRPLVPFVGKLIFGNGPTIGAIDSTGTVTSSVIAVSSIYGAGTGRIYSQLIPALPQNKRIIDIEPSTDGTYVLLATSNQDPEQINAITSNRMLASSGEGALYGWNGVDSGVTFYKTIPSHALSAVQTYLQSNMIFAGDTFGMEIMDGNKKILSLPRNKPPLPSATTVNGNFLSWICPEVNEDNTAINASLYYFGSLDDENPIGLYRLMRKSSHLASGYVHQTPANIVVNNRYQTVNNAITSIITVGLGKHYFSTYEVNTANTTINATTCRVFSFLTTPSGTGTPQLGVYETQTQLFSKKVSVKQVRVYCEPSATNNGFQLDLIGSDGLVLTNGSFTYSFAAGSDPTTLTGALDRINFLSTAAPSYAIGVRITNTGTTNMTIKKCELDIEESGK